MTIFSNDSEIGNHNINYAMMEIEALYGDQVSFIAQPRQALKFGNNPDIDALVWETVWERGGDETYLTTNAIDTLSSSDASDSEPVTITGHTISGTGEDATFTRVTQTATVDGQNKVTLTTPLARVERIKNANGTNFAGNVYVYEDTAITGGVPTDGTKVHIQITGTDGKDQSFKAALTTADGEYLCLSSGWAAITGKVSGSADFEMQYRRPGHIFLPVSRVSVASTGNTTTQIRFEPYAIIPPNSDLRIRAVSSANNTEVNVSLQGIYATVV